MEDELSSKVKKICEIVNDRSIELLEKELTIKCYEDLLRDIEKETDDLQRENQRVCAENEMYEANLERLEFIMRSTEESNAIIIKSLAHYQTFDQLLSKDLEQKQAETKRIKEEFQDIRNEAKRKVTENPLYKEMENTRAKFLEVDIHRRDLEEKVKIQKKINAQRQEVQQRIFYNHFINMAVNYTMEKKLETLEELKAEENRQIRRFISLKEEVATKKRMANRGEMVDISMLIFGNQETRSDKQNNTMESGPMNSHIETAKAQTISDKLNHLFNEDLSMEKSPNVTVVSKNVVEPEFTPPTFVARPEKRKAKTIDLSRKWQKMIRRKTSKDSLNMSICSDTSQLCQTSQTMNDSQSGQYSQSQQENTRPTQSSVQSHFGMMIPSQPAVNIVETIISPMNVHSTIKENLIMDVEAISAPGHSIPIDPLSSVIATPSQPMRNIPQEILTTTDFKMENHNLRSILQKPVEERGGKFQQSIFGNMGPKFRNQPVIKDNVQLSAANLDTTTSANTFMTTAPSQPVRNISEIVSKMADSNAEIHNLKSKLQQPVEERGGMFQQSIFGNVGSIFENQSATDTSGQLIENTGVFMGSGEGEQLNISDMMRNVHSPEFTYQEPDLENPRTPFTNNERPGGYSFFSMPNFNPF